MGKGKKYLSGEYLRAYADRLVNAGYGELSKEENKEHFRLTHPNFKTLEIISESIDLCLIGSARVCQVTLRGNVSQRNAFIDEANKYLRALIQSKENLTS